MAGPRSLLFPIGLTTFLLTVDAAVSLGLVSSMVAFLHTYGRGPFSVNPPSGSAFLLAGEPASLSTNQGHTTNGASGTALVLVGGGGILALWLERRARKKISESPGPEHLKSYADKRPPKQFDRSSPAFYIWGLFVLLSWLLTMAALIFTFVENTNTDGQSIDLGVAAANPAPAKYPDNSWTPETWYAAVLALPLASDVDRGTISGNQANMRAWRWNLVALFILGFVLLTLAVAEMWRMRRRDAQRVPMVEVLAGPARTLSNKMEMKWPETHRTGPQSEPQP